MDEYIKREDAINLLWLYADESCDSVVSDFENLPAATVAEVRHGRWEEIRDPYGNLEGWLCECGREVKIKDDFCPSCGARMDKEDEHEAD